METPEQPERGEERSDIKERDNLSHIERRIADAKTLEELYALVSTIEQIPGSRGRLYQGREQSDKMRNFADFCMKIGIKSENAKEHPLNAAPHAFGIRNKFMELLERELEK